MKTSRKHNGSKNINCRRGIKHRDVPIQHISMLHNILVHRLVKIVATCANIDFRIFKKWVKRSRFDKLSYSSLTLVRTIRWAGFLHFKTKISIKKILGTQGSPSICQFVKRIFIDFLRKIYKWKMKNPLKSHHQFCWVYRVYGIQNDWLDLRNNEFLTVLKTMHCSQRYLQFFD